VIHNDLCWNPTRHEQREDWVDRFGQARSAVRALMLHGGDSNPVDERVRTVILEKEKTIRKELGVSVPIPGNANSITQAVLGGIFGKAAKVIQGFLNLGLPGFSDSGSDLDAVLDAEWQGAKENAEATRAIFAQRSLKAEGIDRLGVVHVAGGAAINRLTTAACGVLCRVRCYTDPPLLSHEPFRVVVLVSADGLLVVTAEVCCHLLDGITLTGACGLCDAAIDDQLVFCPSLGAPISFSRNRPMTSSLRCRSRFYVNVVGCQIASSRLKPTNLRNSKLSWSCASSNLSERIP
jgi:hypothetical protein